MTNDHSHQKIKISTLPEDLTARFKNWQATSFEDQRELYSTLANGQSPHSMVLSCCDSRVHPTELFNTESGEFFIHRNIANLVPPYHPEGDHHGTSAALEFAVNHLKVSRIIVMGHASCGGIKGGHDLCQHGDASAIASTTFIHKWVEMIKPAYDRLDHDLPVDEQVNMLEKVSIMVSMENLMDFPFIQDAIAEGRLALHALWHDIGSGMLYGYDAKDDQFKPI